MRHSALVRVTHWLTFVSFALLLFTGAEIILTHPRFYWGETGNVNMKPLFVIPVPSSRDTVPTGYNYVLPDMNGWGRALHFEMAWVLVITALVYGIAGIWTGHFRKHLLPGKGEWSWRAYSKRIAQYLRFAPPDAAETGAYNVLQKAAYLSVIFVLFPMVIWTGLALSPAFDSAFPWAVNVLGGRQSARTLHFFITDALVVFFVVHVVMVAVSGFRARMRAMITGHGEIPEDHS
ncbi:MAG TPA: cytochrome b/b6 domain-containing protein [Terracidiphilus sp.]|nr:cytochrome b/b6 domain-containing protein [Terracidiphilus sp.]